MPNLESMCSSLQSAIRDDGMLEGIEYLHTVRVSLARACKDNTLIRSFGEGTT